jgi:hypothetical protein
MIATTTATFRFSPGLRSHQGEPVETAIPTGFLKCCFTWMRGISMAFVSSTSTTGNGTGRWDRPSSPTTIRQIKAAQKRRETALEALALTLGPAPRGSHLSLQERAQRVAKLWHELETASFMILAGELL